MSKVKEYIGNHVFQTIVAVTMILFIIDLTNILNNIPFLRNMTNRYAWLGYFGTIMGVFATIRVFELTLANDRENRKKDFATNQKIISDERRLSNLPWLSVKYVLKPSLATFEKLGCSHILYLEIENMGLNHAIVTNKKEDDAPTEMLSENGNDSDNIEKLTIIKKGCTERVPFRITDSRTTRFRIYYMDIYKNYYYDDYEINNKSFCELENGPYYYYGGSLTIKKISEYDSDRSSMV